MTKSSATVHSGKVVTMAGDKLTPAAHDGTEHHRTVSKDAVVTHDGKACKASGLKAGTEVRVTCHEDDKSVATHVAAGKAATKAATQVPPTKVAPTTGHKM